MRGRTREGSWRDWALAHIRGRPPGPQPGWMPAEAPPCTVQYHRPQRLVDRTSGWAPRTAAFLSPLPCTGLIARPSPLREPGPGADVAGLGQRARVTCEAAWRELVSSSLVFMPHPIRGNKGFEASSSSSCRTVTHRLHARRPPPGVPPLSSPSPHRWISDWPVQ